MIAAQQVENNNQKINPTFSPSKKVNKINYHCVPNYFDIMKIIRIEKYLVITKFLHAATALLRRLKTYYELSHTHKVRRQAK